MLAAWLMVEFAQAACPWTRIHTVYATMTSITINQQTWFVKGAAARAEFMSLLQECDLEEEAVSAFEDWRAMRRWTNISGVVGCCLPPVLLAAPVTAVLATQRKDELVAILLSAK